MPLACSLRDKPQLALISAPLNWGSIMKIRILLAGTLAIWLNTASANLISFDLTGVNFSCTPACSSPYEQVTINQTDSTHATITFTALSNALYTYFMGGSGAAAVNVNADSFTMTGLGASGPGAGGFTAPSPSDGGASNENGYGMFNQTIDLFDGYSHVANSISFLLTNNRGTWADAAAVLIGNSLGNVAAAHVFVAANPPSQTSGAVATGYASTTGGGGPPNEAPEPQTLAMLALGLVTLAFIRRRSKA